MGCKSTVGYGSSRLEELKAQLEYEYNNGCVVSDIGKLEQIIKRLDSLDEKLLIIFHFIFFGNYDVIKKYNRSFLSLLYNEPESIKQIIKDEIFSNYNYGNHRKYCKKDYEYYEKAIKSFLELLPELENDLKNNTSFDILYGKISKAVYSFKRTATWDFLEVIDRILLKGKFHPTKMYLRTATGPKRGVLYFFEVNSVEELENKIGKNIEEAGMDILDIVLNSSIKDEIKKDVFLIYKLEDALCNFQKGK